MERDSTFPPFPEPARPPTTADGSREFKPSNDFESRSGATGPRRFAACALIAAVLHLLLRTALTGEPAQVDEPPWLRWLRVVDEHPVRCAFASALLAWALPFGRSSAVRSAGENAQARS